MIILSNKYHNIILLLYHLFYIKYYSRFIGIVFNYIGFVYDIDADIVIFYNYHLILMAYIIYLLALYGYFIKYL